MSARQIPQQVRGIVAARSGGTCELCRAERAVDPHHRLPRGMGGTSVIGLHLPSNLLHLCRRCHDWIEHNRDDAYVGGWLIRTGEHPASVPVWLRGRLYPAGWLLLDDEGCVSLVDPEDDPEDFGLPVVPIVPPWVGHGHQTGAYI